MPPRPKKKVKSFKVPPFYYIPTIIGGMSLITVVALSPDLIPYGRLWYLGKFLHFMAYDLHTLSFVIKLHLSNGDTFKWTVQTFVLGFPSLGLLKAKLNHTQR